VDAGARPAGKSGIYFDAVRDDKMVEGPGLAYSEKTASTHRPVAFGME